MKNKKEFELLEVKTIGTIYLKSKPFATIQVGVFVDLQHEGKKLINEIMSALHISNEKIMFEGRTTFENMGRMIMDDLNKGIARLTIEYKIRKIKKIMMINRIKFFELKESIIKIPKMGGTVN